MKNRLRSREGMNILMNLVRVRVENDESRFDQYSGFLSTLSALRHQRTIRSVSMNETIPVSEKLAFFSRIPLTASMNTDEGLRNILVLVMLFDLWALLPGIVQEVREDFFRRTGQVEVTIGSAVELSESEKNEAISRLREQLGGKSVRPVWSADPALLAGLVLRIGTRVWDGSLKGRMTRMEQELLQA